MVPLQFGVPGGTELLVIVFILLIPAAIAYWVYRDATRRGSDYAWNWAISMFLFALFGFFPVLVGLGLYHSVRHEIGPAE